MNCAILEVAGLKLLHWVGNHHENKDRLWSYVLAPCGDPELRFKYYISEYNIYFKN
jgi:hypothetical protein